MSGIARRSGQGCIAGFAVTLQEQVGPVGSFDFDEFAVGRGLDAASTNCFLVVDMGGADVSTFGGLAALSLKLHEAAGAVIDGGCRDIEDIKRSGLTIASRSVTPRTGKGRVRVVSLGEPVTCGGVLVRSGDMIVVDDTGIVVLPKARLEQVLDTAEKLDRHDSDFIKRLQDGASFSDTAKSLKHV
jgi:regulator of RNase E activity RraA